MGKKHRGSKWMKKKIWRDSMQRFQGGGVCVFLFVFFPPHVVLRGFCLFLFLDFFQPPQPPPPKKKKKRRAAVGGGFLEETFGVERNGALLRVR